MQCTNAGGLRGASDDPLILPSEFFNRLAADAAQDLLGKVIIRRHVTPRKTAIITETDAYECAHDLAGRSARGRTGRTKVMFGPPRKLYVIESMVCTGC
jgi:DNA-3-methyladenine glycosylase